MTKPLRTTHTWPGKIGIAVGIVALIAATASILPALKTSNCSSNSDMGNHAHALVMTILALAHDHNEWPTSTEAYLRQCRAAQYEDHLTKHGRRAFIAWGQFSQAESEKRALPVCIVFDGKRAAVGFSDAHYEYLRDPQLQRFMHAGLASLAEPQGR